MKRIVMATALSVLLLSPALAQDQPGQTGGMMGGQGTMMQQGQMRHPCPMPSGMMAGLLGGSMVATEDGGVVVYAGEKLMKFDKDLKLVKEVEVKIDTAALEKRMQDMWQHCQRCWQYRTGPGGGQMMGPGGGQMMGPGGGQMMGPGGGQMMKPEEPKK